MWPLEEIEVLLLQTPRAHTHLTATHGYTTGAKGMRLRRFFLFFSRTNSRQRHYKFFPIRIHIYLLPNPGHLSKCIQERYRALLQQREKNSVKPIRISVDVKEIPP